MEVSYSVPDTSPEQQNLHIIASDTTALFCVLCNAPCSDSQSLHSHFFFSIGVDGKATTSPIALKIIELLVGDAGTGDGTCEVLSQFPSHVVCRYCFRTLTNLIEEEERLKTRISALKNKLTRTLAKHNVVILGSNAPVEDVREPCSPKVMVLTKIPLTQQTPGPVPPSSEVLETVPFESANHEDATSSSPILEGDYKHESCGRGMLLEEGTLSSNQDSGEPEPKEPRYAPTAVFECDTCQEVFTCTSSLAAHRQQHIENGLNLQGDSLDYAEALLATGTQLHRCRLCVQEFPSVELRERHEKAEHNTYLYCKACDMYFKNRDQLNEHRTTCQNHSSKFMCEQCGKAFANNNSLTVHLRTHTGEKPFKCPECEMTFSQLANMRAHVRTTHLQIRPHECKICGRAFKRRRMLDNHTRSVHTGERPFKCEVCLASFAYVEHLRKHKLIHSDHKPFLCEICGKGFSNRDNRNTHRFTHTDRKPYECKECGARFLRKPQLLQHLQLSQHGDPETAGAAVKITHVIADPVESDDETPLLSIPDCTESNNGQQPVSIMISDSDGKPMYVEVMPHSDDLMATEEETLDSITLEMAQDLVNVSLDL